MSDISGIGRRKLLAGAAGLGLAASLPIGRASAADATTINIAYFVETKPTAIAKAKGWFEQEANAKINWIEVGSGAQINAGVVGGGIDIGIGIGSSPSASGISQGIPYKVIGMLDNIGPAEEMTVRAAANIKTPADFKGKKIATPFGSTSHFRLIGFLKTNNLSLSDVTVLDLPPDQIVAAWKRGDIDGAYVWSPAKAEILADGGEVYETYKELDDKGYVIADLIIARNGFAAAHPDAVTGILRAYGKALSYWQTNPDDAAAIVGQATGVSAAVAAANMKEYDFVPQKEQLTAAWLGTPGNPGAFAAELQHTAEFLVGQKSIRRALKLPAYQKGIDTSYLEKAVA
ncbi:ABC transporter substrate-binding protein [Acidisoma cellulosilytica]|uniref:ABC transporter substrate-binding protein n=1 Tax=Acidisoma cellulosilyticum TaxID=2802395 RepID=A0A964E611_9PROT|nr:ABC transporter substrate-binding protein [Acidisoma cellulosilyticum]MCB8883230.1 ABC transporter substrate-binding protein [Acidisoma cellulosilyticum]